MKKYPAYLLPCLFAGLIAGLLAGCAVSPGPQSATSHQPEAMAGNKPEQSDRDYRTNYRELAARHIYERNRERIYSGVMPHLLHAVAVVEVKLDAQGRLLALHWLRAPGHAPEVVAEIERTMHQAAPFPTLFPVSTTSATTTAPVMSYVETWLWHASGQFQLHTLSEGQGRTNNR